MSGLTLVGCSIWAFLDFATAKAYSETDILESSTSYPALAAIIAVSVITLAVIGWTLTFFCTDCYNAEVDSTSHPACQSSGSGIAVSSQRAQLDEDHDLTNKYLYGPSTQQPLQYYPPASNVPQQNQYSNLPYSNQCSNACPNPSAPNMDYNPQGYQNYQGFNQGYNTLNGYSNQAPQLPPASFS